MNINKIADTFINFLTGKPRATLCIFFLILGLLIPGILTIKSNFSTRIWFDKDHIQTKTLDKYEKTFGSDQTVIISLHDKRGLFNSETLSLIQKITDDLYQVPSVVRVESLANYSFIESKEDEIIIAPFLEDEVESFSEEQISELKKKAFTDEVIPGYFVSKDGTAALLYGYLAPSFEKETDKKASVEKTRKIISSYSKDTEVEFFLMGEITAAESFREVAGEDNKRIVPLIFIVVIASLILIFRSPIAVFLPLFLVFVTMVGTFGIFGWIGFIYNNMLAAIPGILFAICLADAVHVLIAYYHFVQTGHNNQDSMKLSLKKNFIPTLLTSFTTAVGFISISFTEIVPIHDLGIIAAIGTMLAWLFTYLLFSSFFGLFNSSLEKNLDKARSRKSFHNFSFEKKFTQFVSDNTKKIIISFVLITTACAYIATRNEVNSDPIKFFDPKVPLRHAYEFISTKINGIRGADLVVDSGINDGIKDPLFLAKIENFTKELREDPQITHVKSINIVLKKLNKVMNQNNPEFYKIPPTQKAIAETLFFYQLGLPPGSDLNNQISLDNSQMRLKVLWSINTSKESEEKLKEIELIAQKHELNIWVGGNLPIYTRMNGLIVTSFFYSFITALSFVMILIFFVFRDVKLSLLSLLPNLFPLIIGGAALYSLGYYVDIGTSMVIVVCLGIAVDDTIHFITNYQKIRSEGETPTVAVEKTFSITGKALILTTFLLITGFGSFLFANFVPNQNFGVLCSIILLFALLTDLLFLPAVLIELHKNK